MIITFPHKPPSKGGPGSFQVRFEKALKKRGWSISYSEDNCPSDIIMVVGGTKKIGWLLNRKRKGVPIVHRLDGINWLHRKLKTPPKSWIKSEARNYLFDFTRSFISDYIIYQSKFVQKWWDKKGWKADKRHSIIYNGVDIEEFRPKKRDEELSILCLEGNLDYSPYAIDLLNDLQEKLIESSDYNSLILYGGFISEENRKKLSNKIDYRGIASREKLSDIYRNAVYLSLDVNAACPNTVIEALASGIPVIGFDTGALNELVDDRGGIIVPYGSNPWNLAFPNSDLLCKAALKIKEDWLNYSKGARKIAEDKYDIKIVVNKYLNVINEILQKKQT